MRGFIISQKFAAEINMLVVFATSNLSLTLRARMCGGLQYSLLSVSVCVCHTAVLHDGESPAADTVDASSM